MNTSELLYGALNKGVLSSSQYQSVRDIYYKVPQFNSADRSTNPYQKFINPGFREFLEPEGNYYAWAEPRVAAWGTTLASYGVTLQGALGVRAPYYGSLVMGAAADGLADTLGVAFRLVGSRAFMTASMILESRPTGSPYENDAARLRALPSYLAAKSLIESGYYAGKYYYFTDGSLTPDSPDVKDMLYDREGNLVPGSEQLAELVKWFPTASQTPEELWNRTRQQLADYRAFSQISQSALDQQFLESPAARSIVALHGIQFGASPRDYSGFMQAYQPPVIHFAFNPADPLGWAADNGDFSAIARMVASPFAVPSRYTGAPNTVNPDAYSLNNLPASRLRSIIDAGGQSQLQNPYRSWSDFDAAQATSAFLAGGKLPGSLNFNALNRLGNRILADLNRLAPQATPTIGGSSGRIPVPPGYTQQLSSFHAAATAPISPSQALPSNFSTPSGWQLLSNNGYGGIGLGNGAVIGYNPNFANGRVPGISFTIPLPPFPVILDLDGDGLRIDPLSSSTQFVDQNGDGYHSRIAWAGKGDGVLVLDADHDGKLSNAKEFAFTEWDSTAKGDLEALKNIFDTNHNGKLDAGDAKWADFKVLVDGQMKSLSELGIASIDLTPSGSGQSFSDGSAITGTTTFTRTNGTTGAAGDAVLATESGSYIVKQTKTTNADGSVTTD
ncbi:hypothetical protein, partial [Labrys sp. 22185]|uniref:hypothetical protein n=1 Tax=Labrys sp. 22185 TaxID=3453888 RepID=UPI003F83595F